MEDETQGFIKDLPDNIIFFILILISYLFKIYDYIFEVRNENNL